MATQAIAARSSLRQTQLVRPAVRLTARGQLVVRVALVVVLVALIGLVALVRGFSAPAGASDRPALYSIVVVQSGQTLWQIAQRIAPNADPRDTVDFLRTLNGLGAEPLRAGLALRIPAAS